MFHVSSLSNSHSVIWYSCIGLWIVNLLLQPENDYEMEDRKTKQTICLCSVVRFGGGCYVVVVTVPSFQVGNQTSKDNIALVM